jgi:hypothetical protein
MHRVKVDAFLIALVVGRRHGTRVELRDVAVVEEMSDVMNGHYCERVEIGL